MSRHTRRRRWKRASRKHARAVRRIANLQEAALRLGRVIVRDVERLLPGLPPVGTEPGPVGQQAFREVAVRITDIDRLRFPGHAVPVRDIVGAIRHDIERRGPVQFLKLPPDQTSFSVLAGGRRTWFRVAFTCDPTRCLITLRIVYLLQGLPADESKHELRFIGGPMHGHREHWPARAAHVVVFPVCPPISVAAVVDDAFELPPIQSVTYREKRRMHMPTGRDEFGMQRPSRLLYIEMEVAP